MFAFIFSEHDFDKMQYMPGSFQHGNFHTAPSQMCLGRGRRFRYVLRLRQGNEKEVNDALAVPMSRCNEVFAAIRKNGIYKHNIEMMKSTECELLRERQQGKLKDLVLSTSRRGCCLC